MRQKPEAVCTTAMIIINIAVFLILSVFGNTEDAVFMLRHGAMYEPMIVQDHEFYRIFTSMFMHFGISHLLNNMVLLGALGWNLELEAGKIRFVIIYLISGIGGNMLSLYHGLSTETYAVSALLQQTVRCNLKHSGKFYQYLVGRKTHIIFIKGNR